MEPIGLQLDAKLLQLILEQHRFELHRSTYMLFIFKNKYAVDLLYLHVLLPQDPTNCRLKTGFLFLGWESVDMEGQLKLHRDFCLCKESMPQTPTLFKGLLYTFYHKN